MRGGLALIDRLSERSCRQALRERAAIAQRRQVLDEIAYTSNPDPGLSHAMAFFSSFRDLTASGFWSTKMGVQDLQYQGNTLRRRMGRMPGGSAEETGREVQRLTFNSTLDVVNAQR